MFELSNSNKDEHPERNTVVHNYFFSSWGRYKYIFLWLCCDLPQLSCSLSHTFAHMHCNLPLLH